MAGSRTVTVFLISVVSGVLKLNILYRINFSYRVAGSRTVTDPQVFQLTQVFTVIFCTGLSGLFFQCLSEHFSNTLWFPQSVFPDWYQTLLEEVYIPDAGKDVLPLSLFRLWKAGRDRVSPWKAFILYRPVTVHCPGLTGAFQGRLCPWNFCTAGNQGPAVFLPGYICGGGTPLLSCFWQYPHIFPVSLEN